MTTIIRLKPLVYNLAIPLAVGSFASFLSGDYAEAYNNLSLPAFAPSHRIFPLMCTLLYLLMGYSAYLVFTSPKAPMPDKGAAAAPYFAQLFAHVVWFPLFFRFGLYSFCSWLSVILLALTVLSFRRFRAVDSAAAKLLLPYVAWMLFLVILGFSIAARN